MVYRFVLKEQQPIGKILHLITQSRKHISIYVAGPEEPNLLQIIGQLFSNILFPLPLALYP